MTVPQQDIWQDWQRRLHNWGLEEPAAALLEATAPLHLIGASLVYLTQPTLNAFFADDRLSAMAELLEDPGSTQAFIAGLREAAA